ncbi:hypothetical protein [Caproiciproducens sp. CPB-2]|uniref:hypothetical protein n=1 Tax=Caproiciproducens sp. CPB-2 TaxID=3030017 RepID=UPI0023DBA2A4|nr:hypothetical protein [Caproiciproducens sp. CPB-2]MDF1493248.1 hypothetical protein [Caproiciproducens sp. CPB-2]
MSVPVLLLAVVGILFALALNDPNAPLAPGGETDSSAVTAKLLVAAGTGKPAELTGEEVGALMTQKLAQNGQRAVSGVRLTVNSDNTVDAYLPVSYKGMKLGVSANLTVGWDSAKKEIRAAVNSVKIGRLPVDPAWALSHAMDSLPKGAGREGNILYLPPPMFGTYEMPNDAPGSISGLEVRYRKFLLNFSVDMAKLEDYLKEQLKSIL